MIEFTKSYKTADGQVFGTIEKAQIHEIKSLFSKSFPDTERMDDIAREEIAHFLMDNKDILIDVLTTTPNSKPKARATHGGTKTRKKTVITDASTTLASSVNTPTTVQGVRV